MSDFAVEHVEKPQPAGPEESVVVDLDVWVFLEHWFWVVESVRGTRSYRLHSRVIDDSNPQKGVTSVDVTPFCGEESTKESPLWMLRHSWRIVYQPICRIR